MNKIKNQKISDFESCLSSKSPTPGGGAVAALSASLAAGLCEMVINLTKEDTGIKIKRVEILRERLLELADEDVKAFNAVMASYREKNKKEIEKAFKGATIIPLETARLSEEIKKFAYILTKRGNKNTYSDAKTAYYLSDAARKSAIENVKINLKYIKDKKWKKKIKY